MEHESSEIFGSMPVASQLMGNGATSSIIKLNQRLLACLLAIYRCQPATVKLIELTADRRPGSVSSSLKDLSNMGLVSRAKHNRGPREITREERLGFIIYKRKLGKRPYIYNLTLPGRRIARDIDRLQKSIDHHFEGAQS